MAMRHKVPVSCGETIVFVTACSRYCPDHELFVIRLALNGCGEDKVTVGCNFCGHSIGPFALTEALEKWEAVQEDGGDADSEESVGEEETTDI